MFGSISIDISSLRTKEGIHHCGKLTEYFTYMKQCCAKNYLAQVAKLIICYERTSLMGLFGGISCITGIT